MAMLKATVQPPNIVFAFNADGNAYTTITVTPPPISVVFDAPGHPGTEYDGVANFVASGIGVTLTVDTGSGGGGAGSSGGGGGGGSSNGGGGA